MTAQEYKVTKVSTQEPKVYEGQYGTTYYIKVMLEGVDEPVEIGKKSPDALKQGDTVYGTVTDGQYGKKFKAEKKPFGQPGGSKYNRDDAAIRAQWAIGQSVGWFSTRKTVDEHLNERIEELAKVFYAMVDRVKGSVSESPKTDWVKPEVREKLQPKEDTPPVDAYDNINEDTEINLDDIPF